MFKSLTGTVLDERYEVLEQIGEGTFGVVYKARHLLMNRLVAVKLLKADLSSSSAELEKFSRLVKTLAELSHPGIVKIYDFGIYLSGQPYLITDYLPGGSLADWLVRQGRLEARTVLPIFVQICDALSQAHKSGIIHADLKPTNIMFAESPDSQRAAEQIKLVDFSVSQLIPQAIAQNLTVAASAGDGGSLSYASPEQAKAQQLSASSDIYSLGCIMYECLTGKRPLRKRGKNSLNDMMPEQWESACPGLKLPKALEQTVFKSLEWTQERRYTSADDLKGELLAIIAKNKTLQFKREASQGPPADSRNNRKLLILVSLAAVAVIVCAWSLINSHTTSLAISEAHLQIQLALKESMNGSPADIQALRLRLANLYLDSNNLPDAERLLKQLPTLDNKQSEVSRDQVKALLRLIEAKAGKNSSAQATAQALTKLKDDISARKLPAEKLVPIFKEYLASCQRLLGERHKNSINALRLVAMEEDRLKNYAEEEIYLNEALKAASMDSEETAVTLEILACMYWHSGKFEKAEEFLQREIKIREKTQPAGTVDKSLITPITFLTTIYAETKNYNGAVPWLLREVDLRDRWRQFDYENIVRMWAVLGTSCLFTGNIPDATKYYETASKVMRDHGVEPMKNISVGLISCYLLSNNWKQAKGLIEKSSVGISRR